MSGPFDILVIDDESVIIDSVVKVGEYEGHTVDSARTAGAGLVKLGANRYRIMICDIMMPEMDGFRFLDEIRGMGIDTPVIMTTGLSTLQNAVKSLLAGAIGFLPKPFTVGELMSRIRRALKYEELLGRMRSGELREADFFEDYPAEYRRLGQASWLNTEAAGVVSVGVMALFLQTIDPVVRLDLLDADEQVQQGNVCASFATDTLLVHGLRSPVSGRIIARNEKIVADPRSLVCDPYREGWLYKIVPNNLEDERELLKVGIGM